VCIYEQITPHQLFLVSAKNKKIKTKITILWTIKNRQKIFAKKTT
jgi:hypothetical protein